MHFSRLGECKLITLASLGKCISCRNVQIFLFPSLPTYFLLLPRFSLGFKVSQAKKKYDDEELASEKTSNDSLLSGFYGTHYSKSKQIDEVRVPELYKLFSGGGGRNSLPNLFNFRILFVFPGKFHIRPETNARIMQLIKCFDYLCVCVAR